MPDALTPDHELTILLTLKDRVSFTYRWMAYANAFHFPFKVLVADGGADEDVANVLSDRANFPNLDYSYIRYPFDSTYANFYAKVTDALSRIRTPFVVMADNDDLFVVDGLRQAVRFLIDHPDYATCGGQCAVFWVTPSGTVDPSGALYGSKVEWKCSLDTQSLTNETARSRVRSQSLRATYPIYYHVQRTEALREHFETVRAWNPSDLFLLEQLLSSRAAIAGKTKQLDALYIARQWDSTETAGGAHIQAFGDWLGRMLVPSWSDDFVEYVRILSTALAARDGIPMDEARACVIESYRMQAAPPLLSDVLKAPTVNVPMSVVVRIVRRLLRRSPNSPVRRLARMLYRRIRWIPVDAVHGMQFRTKAVANAAQEFQPIRDFLTRREAAEHR